MSALPPHVVRAITFDLQNGGVILEYFRPAVDVRENGLIANHTLAIPDSDEFDDLIIGLQKKTDSLLSFALASLAAHQPADLTDPDDDSRPGYDNPNERDVIRG